MSESPPPDYHHAAPVNDLWFDDGNLILKAENSLFRIYSGLLAARSSVFKDMLGFPAPEGGNTTLDGCPIVTVYDSARDMGFFLRAVFDSSYFEPAPAPTELPIVEAVLRLSLKYDVKYLRRRALNHLSSTFPLTLTGWKTRDTLRTIPPVDNTPFAAFRLAREFELAWLLPAILYCISSHPFEKTLDGAPWADEKIQLEWTDKRMAIVGRQRLLSLQHHSALGMARAAGGAPVQGCSGAPDQAACSSTRMRCAEVLGGWDMAGFLDYFEDHAEMYEEDLCGACSTAFREQCSTDCEAMWAKLPDMFGLPDWEILDRMRLKALE